MTWLYPSFLWALLALLIPIIVHLFNFRRYKKIAFTNLRFLKQINQQTKSGNQLRKLLILGSRILAITFLVFAFAQPVRLHKNQELNTAKHLVNIILDNSYSMNNNGTEGPLLEEAKNRARAIVNAASNNDEFQIITSDLNAAYMHNSSKQTALENIDKIKINAGSKPLTQLLALQERLINKSVDQKNLFIISDFQKNNPPYGSQDNNKNIQKTWVKIPSDNSENISIDTCYLNSPILQVGGMISLTAELSNYSENEIQGFTVDLLVDNQPKGIANFDIKPFSKSRQTFNFVLDKGGEHECLLAHKGDNMGFDDKLYFSLNLKTDFNVINIFDKKEHYINNVFNETNGFNYTGFSSGNVQYNTFGNASLICLEGSNNISNGMAGELKNYVESGGNLFIFPQADLANGGLQALTDKFGFTVSESTITLNGKVSEFDREHPVFQHLFDKVPKSPDLPTVNKYYSILAGNGIAMMKLNNGASFITDLKVKNGHVFICASPLNPDYTNFQNHAFFVPVLLKSALLARYHANLYFKCGQTENIPTGLPYMTEKDIILKTVNNSFIPEVINTGGEMFLNTNGEIEQPGWYRIYNTKKDTGLMTIAFNLDRIESDTRTFSENELQNIASENGAVLFSGSAEKLSSDYSSKVKGNPLWKWCIIFVLFFLMIEILLIRFLKPNAKLST